MKIGILGTGDVGKALFAGFRKHGYEVKMGSRKGSDQTVAFEEAAKFGDIIILAVKGLVALDALKMSGNLDGKIIIDATNPIADSPPENGVLKFFTSLDESLMEQLQKSFPKAKFVKAFNSIGSAFMVNPDFKDMPSMCICGNDEAAKKEVSKILVKFGFEVEDMGKVEAARAIEPLCMLWCIPGFLRNDWQHAFRLLRK